MNRADFVAADGQSWWLWETQIDSQTEEARKDLGAALGFTETEWFADPNRRTVLFDLLESYGSTLLNDLDYLSDDAKLQWVRGAVHLAAPPPPPPATTTQDDTTDAAQPAQPAQADTPPAAPPPAPAPAKKSIFKSKSAADGADPARTADGAANEAAATNGASDSNASGPAEAPQLDQAVQTVLADVTGGGLAGLAQDLGVEADELGAIVNHPDFEREVREEVARITAG